MNDFEVQSVIPMPSRSLVAVIGGSRGPGSIDAGMALRASGRAFLVKRIELVPGDDEDSGRVSLLCDLCDSSAIQELLTPGRIVRVCYDVDA